MQLNNTILQRNEEHNCIIITQLEYAHTRAWLTDDNVYTGVNLLIFFRGLNCMDLTLNFTHANTSFKKLTNHFWASSSLSLGKWWFKQSRNKVKSCKSETRDSRSQNMSYRNQNSPPLLLPYSKNRNMKQMTHAAHAKLSKYKNNLKN